MSSIHVPEFEESTDPFLNPDQWCKESEAIHWVEEFYEFPEWCSLHGRYEISSHGRIKSLMQSNKIMVPHPARVADCSAFRLVYRLSLPRSRQVEVGADVLLQIAFADTLRSKGIEPMTDFPKVLNLEYISELEQRKTVKKIPDDVVRDIRVRRQAGETYVAIAERYNLRPEQCRKICIRQTYKQVV
jgi:hypothetical protein